MKLYLGMFLLAIHARKTMQDCGVFECDKRCFGSVLFKADGCPICLCNPEEEYIDDMRFLLNQKEFMNKQIRTDEYMKSIKNGETGRLQGASNAAFGRWNTYPGTDGNWNIPFVIQQSIDPVIEDLINAAMNDFEALLCFKFIPRVAEPNYLSFSDDGTETCWSYIGRLTDQPNEVQLNLVCRSKGTVLHEIMHALGFFHEQQRPDRDDHVIVVWENIKPGQESNFYKNTDYIDSQGSPYDIRSIMHYFDTAFGIDGTKTLTGLDGLGLDTQKTELSETDIQQIAAMYSCPDKTVTTTPEATTQPATTTAATTTPEITTPPPASTTVATTTPETTTASTTTAPKATTTTKTTTIAPVIDPEPCSNRIRKCRKLKQDGYCSNKPVKAKKNCAVTCGLCDCKDLYDDCPAWTDYGYCTSLEFQAFMQWYCPISCGYCGKACDNSRRRCKNWAKNGACFNDPIFMAQNCKKSCNYCIVSNTGMFVGNAAFSSPVEMNP